MAETYPQDDSLLARTEDARTGVEYIETGKAPYYLEFRRMLYRILANLAPLGLRVFKTGPLAAQVKPGHYWLGGQLKFFSGTQADLTLANNDTLYVYLNDANQAAAVSAAAGWPTAEHVRLATVATSAGGFEPDDIVDLRGHSLLSSLPLLTATPAEISRALAGVSADVTAAHLNTLTGGGDAGALHTHPSGVAGFTLVNNFTIAHNGAAVVHLEGEGGEYAAGTPAVAPGTYDGQLLTVVLDNTNGNYVTIVGGAAGSGLNLNGGGDWGVTAFDPGHSLGLRWNAGTNQWDELWRGRGNSYAKGNGNEAFANSHVNDSGATGCVALASADVDGAISNAMAVCGGHAQADQAFACQGYALGMNSAVFNGAQTEATATCGLAHGQYGLARDPNSYVHGAASLPTAAHQAQFVRQVLRGSTTNATPAELVLPARYTVPDECTCAVLVTVVGRQDTGANNASYIRRLIIKRTGGTVALVGTVAILGTDIESDNSWNVTVTADDANKSMAVTVTGKAATNINWVAVVEAAECGNAD